MHRWKHHASKKSVLVKSQAELDELGEGWGDKILQDHPNGYQKGHKVKHEKSDSPEIDSEGLVDSGAGEEIPGDMGDESKAEVFFDKLSEDELKEELVKKGVPAKKLKGKSKAELIAMFEV